MARGLFVVLEGADGTGKTTQANRLSSMLNDNGKLNLQTTEMA